MTNGPKTKTREREYDGKEKKKIGYITGETKEKTNVET